jgi:hypothetical protein
LADGATLPQTVVGREQTSGLLIAALELLAGHYGLARRKSVA